MSPALHWTAVTAWLLLSFFMSGMEAGVQGLSPLRIRHWVRKGRPGARTLLRYLEQPENFLWTILVGNTLANFAAAGLIFADLQARLAGRPVAFWMSFVGVCAVLYLFCDLLPKTLFRRFPNRLCLRLVIPFRAVHFALAPPVAVAEWSTRLLLRITRGTRYTGRLFGNRDEFRALMQEAGGALSATERSLINRVLDLQNATLARVNRPLDTAITVEVDTPVEQILTLCREHNVARLPVWQGSGKRRRIAGVVRLVDLIHAGGTPTGTAAAHLRPALFLDEGLRLDQALRRLQRGGDQFAIVVGPDGRERGLVTLWDVLGEFFGGRRG
jgi:CBS domain containing-hemolysin-like protein